MKLSIHTWQVNKNSVSVNYGPLTPSLKINEEYIQKDSRSTAIYDSRWQEGADATQWPSYEIFPKSPWNYALVLDSKVPLKNFKVIRKEWPSDNFPFTVSNVPLGGESHRKANTFLDTRQVRIMQRIARNQRPQRRQGRDHIDTDGRRPVESFCFSKHLRINQQPYKLILP